MIHDMGQSCQLTCLVATLKYCTHKVPLNFCALLETVLDFEGFPSTMAAETYCNVRSKWNHQTLLFSLFVSFIPHCLPVSFPPFLLVSLFNSLCPPFLPSLLNSLSTFLPLWREGNKQIKQNEIYLDLDAYTMLVSRINSLLALAFSGFVENNENIE